MSSTKFFVLTYNVAGNIIDTQEFAELHEAFDAYYIGYAEKDIPISALKVLATDRSTESLSDHSRNMELAYDLTDVVIRQYASFSTK